MRRSRRSATCCGMDGCPTVRSWAICSRSLPPAAPLPDGVIRLLRQLPPSEAMDTLRTAASALAHYDRDAADNSPAANYRKAVRLTAQMGSLVAAIGRLEQNQGPIDPDPVMGFAANFLYQLTGPASRRAGRARHRLRAGPARRPRAQRVDLCGARGRRHAHRHPLGHRRRHRRAEGAAARRRQRGSDEDAARLRRDGVAREGRDHDPREAGEEGEDSRLRPPRLQDDGPARGALAPVVEGPGQAVGADATGSRCPSASRRW